jgi:HTH-type transcriptional regulator/antitoxin HigA
MSVIDKELQAHWSVVAPLFSIRNERDYDVAIQRLNQLIDEVGIDEQHPLYGLLDALGAIIRTYEEQHHPMPGCTGAEALQYLMEEHGLAQSGLPEVGSQGVISEILRGKRSLNARQIRALASRFAVSPAVFF